MNLVAHQYLSFNQPSIQIGNLLGEVVKGNKFNLYTEEISKGILLHRAIDHFTDHNTIVKDSTSYFHPTQHKYAPIIIDLMYDYFLIKNWSLYYFKSFKEFKDDCYNLFIANYNSYPNSLKILVDHLLKHDWFSNYETLDGIQKTLNGISRKTNFPNNLDNSLQNMIDYQEIIEEHFLLFFPKIITMSQNFITKS